MVLPFLTQTGLKLLRTRPILICVGGDLPTPHVEQAALGVSSVLVLLRLLKNRILYCLLHPKRTKHLMFAFWLISLLAKKTQLLAQARAVVDCRQRPTQAQLLLLLPNML